MDGCWFHSRQKGCSCPLGLFTFGSFLKIMANQVFSCAFQHPEFSAGRKSRFRARLGAANFVWNFEITMGNQKIKFIFSTVMEHLFIGHLFSVLRFLYFPFNLGSFRCALIRVFQIWSQNWNPIIFDPFFGPKTIENWLNWIFAVFDRVFFCQKGAKFYSISILRPDLESSRQATSN